MPLGEDDTVAALPETLRLRPARATDVPALSALIADHAAFHGDKAETKLARLADDLFGERPWLTALVAEKAGRIVGYCLLAPLYRADLSARGMEIHQIFVAEGHRGEGVGRHLIDCARRTASQMGCTYLSVGAATGNFQAHRFYEGLAFRPQPVTGMRYLQAL
nr:GNAT family N-acetyltransferase [Rhizobium sp. RU20A]